MHFGHRHEVVDCLESLPIEHFLWNGTLQVIQKTGVLLDAIVGLAHAEFPHCSSAAFASACVLPVWTCSAIDVDVGCLGVLSLPPLRWYLHTQSTLLRPHSYSRA